jgi:hypothetical protein
MPWGGRPIGIRSVSAIGESREPDTSADPPLRGLIQRHWGWRPGREPTQVSQMRARHRHATAPTLRARPCPTPSQRVRQHSGASPKQVPLRPHESAPAPLARQGLAASAAGGVQGGRAPGRALPGSVKRGAPQRSRESAAGADIARRERSGAIHHQRCVATEDGDPRPWLTISDLPTRCLGSMASASSRLSGGRAS